MSYDISKFINISQLSKIDLINLLEGLNTASQQSFHPFINEYISKSISVLNDELYRYDMRLQSKTAILSNIQNIIQSCSLELQNDNAPNFFIWWNKLNSTLSEFNQILSEKMVTKDLFINQMLLINSELSKIKNPYETIIEPQNKSLIIPLLNNSINITNNIKKELYSTAETVPTENIITKYLSQLSNIAIQPRGFNTPCQQPSEKHIDKDNIYVLNLSKKTAYFKLENDILITASEEEIKKGRKVSLKTLKNNDDGGDRSRQVSREWEF